ncbi:DUF89-domain-containing protein [Delitschia confertaspora ATCC 74209]|uniref:Sugar phosphate phosphatase n=1 Tax=Delitschia confertaspora ATCC 74209 TaxID=1513339 RepID=A0A9P4JLW4_9PLEO|nr:DUF89-domain-containing protein [Delitschia confertaspora ATCC 74209]
MEYDTKTPQYKTSDPTSFAYVSARERWPVIITQGIDDVHRSTWQTKDEETVKEGKWIVSELAKLKYELQHDRQLSPLLDDGEPDILGYNKELEALGNPKWHSVPWLFSECYLYRRISTIFSQTQKWKSYDIFARQKMSTFKSSRPAVLELAAKYKDIVTELESKHTLKGAKTEEEVEAAEKVLFNEMMEICLWGNATDLSLLTNLSYEDIQKLQGSEARKASEKNIIVNDLGKAFDVLTAAKHSGKKERRLDIVLDNAGFELFVDLILAGYLLAAGLVTTIVLHPKSIPWFVSDVLPGDFASLISALADPQSFYTSSDDDNDAGKATPLTDEEVSNLQFLFQHWSGFHAEGQLVLRPNRFWTEGGSYWRLPATATDLLEDFKESELIVFKGDLNYRKLTADVSATWPATTPFAEAIGPLGPKSGVRVLALRTCKADVVVGLPEGEDERLRGTDNGGGSSGARKWAWSGKYAVVQFCDGKAS